MQLKRQWESSPNIYPWKSLRRAAVWHDQSGWIWRASRTSRLNTWTSANELWPTMPHSPSLPSSFPRLIFSLFPFSLLHPHSPSYTVYSSLVVSPAGCYYSVTRTKKDSLFRLLVSKTPRPSRWLLLTRQTRRFSWKMPGSETCLGTFLR